MTELTKIKPRLVLQNLTGRHLLLPKRQLGNIGHILKAPLRTPLVLELGKFLHGENPA